MEQATASEAKAICLRANEELFELGRTELAEELVSDTFVDHAAPPGAPSGVESIVGTVRMLHSALSDIRYEIHDAIAEGDSVAIRLTMHGTHTGELFGNPATGRSFSAEQIHMFRVADGRISEHWARRDDVGMMRQLGLGG